MTGIPENESKSRLLINSNTRHDKKYGTTWKLEFWRPNIPQWMPLCEMPIPGKPNGDPLQTEFGSYLLQEGSQYTVRYKPWQQEASQAEVNSQPVLHMCWEQDQEWPEQEQPAKKLQIMTKPFEEQTPNWSKQFTTCNIDFDMATASTGTTDPISRPVKRGVTSTEAMVVELVRRMVNATSPLLKKLA